MSLFEPGSGLLKKLSTLRFNEVVMFRKEINEVVNKTTEDEDITTDVETVYKLGDNWASMLKSPFYMPPLSILQRCPNEDKRGVGFAYKVKRIKLK